MIRALFTNKLFIIAIVFIIIQQLLIGGSTFFIASAGTRLSTASSSEVMNYIILFFVSVGLAYLIGSIGLFIGTKVANQMWYQYTFDLSDKLSHDLSYSAAKNRLTTNNWIGGEALATIDNAVAFILDFISLYGNIIFTLVAFWFSLGPVITSTIMFALLISILLLSFNRSIIGQLGNDIQTTKLGVLSKINYLWDFMFFSPTRARKAYQSNAKIAAKDFLINKIRYKRREQITAIIPIFLAIILVITASIYSLDNGMVLLGTLVATLPRSLQVFQSIHSVSMYNSKIVLIIRMLDNLNKFPEQLEKQNFAEQIKHHQISILSLNSTANDTKEYTVQLFKDLLVNTPNLTGRFLISGVNGSGKSSFLKLLKTNLVDATYLGPDVYFDKIDHKLSTGQRMDLLLQELFVHLNDYQVILLDEWDANLDTSIKTDIDQQLTKFALTNLIIEVRH